MKIQPTRRADKRNPTFQTHLVRTRGIQLFNHIWSKTRESVSLCIAMATQFTASERLKDPGHLSDECLQLHCVERYSEHALEEINVLQA